MALNKQDAEDSVAYYAFAVTFLAGCIQKDYITFILLGSIVIYFLIYYYI